jgi:hypothetical protein
VKSYELVSILLIIDSMIFYINNQKNFCIMFFGILISLAILFSLRFIYRRFVK